LYQAHVRRELESERDGAIYDKLKKGPVFEEEVDFTVPREPLVEEIRKLITPSENSRHYPLILGEHGTGKTSLIKLAVDGINENKPKGIVYVSIPIECNLEVQVARAMQAALGWSPNKLIDASKCNYSSSLLMSIA
jgi:type II secretory pathway predicted ATPase ExeA